MDGSFSKLSDLVLNTSEGNTLYLTKDYKFNETSDNNYKKGIDLNLITIDGMGHTIDANGQARIFNVFNNVTLNNLKLINGHADKGGAIFSNFSITCNNIVFENNTGVHGGSIYTLCISLNDCKFAQNYADNGSSIFLETKSGGGDYPDSFINNTSFNNMKSSSVFNNGTPSDLYIFNSSFENISGYVGSAIYSNNGGNTLINNSKFKNLKSTDGGAILAKSSNIKLYNSDFINIRHQIMVE